MQALAHQILTSSHVPGENRAQGLASRGACAGTYLSNTDRSCVVTGEVCLVRQKGQSGWRGGHGVWVCSGGQQILDVEDLCLIADSVLCKRHLLPSSWAIQ